MRTITDHKLNGLNDAINIIVLDDFGPGNANHKYQIDAGELRTLIDFQKGPIQEAGINGISNEALIAIVIDRLRGFQGGLFSCRENAIALTNLEEALMWLQKQTRDRVNRGVEGTSNQ